MNRDSSRKQAMIRALQAKLYTLRKRRNPLFPERAPQDGLEMQRLKGSRWRAISRFGLPAAFVVACLTIPIILSLGPWLKTTSVTLTGTMLLDNALLTERIEGMLEGKKVGGIIRRNHPWFLPLQEITTTLQTEYPIAQVTFQKKKETLAINITEELFIVGIADVHGVWYIMSHDGSILRAAEPGEIEALQARANGELVPEGTPPYAQELALITIRGQHAVTIGESLMHADIVKGLADFHEQAVRSGLQIKSYAIDDPKAQTWFNAQLAEDIDVYIDPRKDAAQQIQSLQSVLHEVVPTRESIEYIDVRFGDRVFIK